MVIQKTDKGNAIVIIDKSTYITKMNILNDDTKFVKSGKSNKELLNKQEEIVTFL